MRACNFNQLIQAGLKAKQTVVRLNNMVLVGWLMCSAIRKSQGIGMHGDTSLL